MPPFSYTFPAIRGLQAGRAYFVTMCPLRLIPKIFLFDEEELAVELRAQRTLNKARVPEIARYMRENRGGYVFSALTASVDADVKFDPLGTGDLRDVGLLHVPLNARFVINDGQHRRAGIEQALKEVPELGDETISVVLFVDPGTARAQQMFTDLNRHAVRPSRSLGVLFDQRDEAAVIAREVVKTSKFFPGLVEFERSTLAPRSSRLFTLSAIETATSIFLADQGGLGVPERVALAAEFWDVVAELIPEWLAVKAKKVSAGDVRQDSVSAHGIALSAIAYVGRALLEQDPTGWQQRLQGLKGLDWSRANAAQWEGRAMVAGKLSKAHNHVRLTASALKLRVGVELSSDEAQLEAAFASKEQG